MSSEPKAVVNLWEVLSFFLGNSPKPVIVDQPTDMMVIGAGFSRTGTTSLKEALRRLGFKSYHMKYAFMIDTDLWYEHGLERLQGKPGIYYPKIVQAMAQQGYNATVDNPNCLYYKELMEYYPNAKVILTLRADNGGGESFATSAMNTFAWWNPLFARIPYKWFPITPKVDLISKWHFAEHGTPIDPVTFFPNREELVQRYETWIDEVIATVPPEKLLVHKATEGWEPLCEFLSPMNPTTAKTCEEILQSNEPYPYINDTAAFIAIQDGMRTIATCFENAPKLFFLMILIWWYHKKMSKNTKSKSKHGGDKQQQLATSKEKNT